MRQRDDSLPPDTAATTADPTAAGTDPPQAAGQAPRVETVVPPPESPSVVDQIGEAAGGLSGMLAGAGIGGVAGPVGSVIGGIAGALGGWWSGRAIAEAAAQVTQEDDDHYRAHYTSAADRDAARHYEEMRAAYFLGHIASHNPNFTSRMFDEVEPELREGWQRRPEPEPEWEQVREFVREGFERGLDRRSWSERRLLPRPEKEDTDRRGGRDRRYPEW